METLLEREPQTLSHSESESSAERIREITAICERAAGGDLEARIVGIDPDTDFGRLCQAVNHVLDISDSFVREASAAMDTCSRDKFHRPILLRGLHGAYAKSAAIINRAGLKMKESADQLQVTARLAADTSSNVSMVAAACEELTSSSSEISRQTKTSLKLTEKAVQDTSSAAAAVQELNGVARKIDNIVALIHKIAGQTNLLALNATIEAARAGEHGKGFAVVANEVKELSRNSAKATEEISQQVETMQHSVQCVAESIGGIGKSIEEVNTGANTICKSLEEQLQATSDIARNIAFVSEKTAQISQRISSK